MPHTHSQPIIDRQLLVIIHLSLNFAASAANSCFRFVIHSRSWDSRLFIYKTNKRNISLHNVFTSARVFAALASAVLVARLFAVVAMTFPTGAGGKFSDFTFDDVFPLFRLFLGIFLFYTQLKIAKLFGRTSSTTRRVYTRGNETKKVKTLTHSSTTLSHTRAQTHWTREKVCWRNKRLRAARTENEHEALCVVNWAREWVRLESNAPTWNELENFLIRVLSWLLLMIVIRMFPVICRRCCCTNKSKRELLACDYCFDSISDTLGWLKIIFRLRKVRDWVVELLNLLIITQGSIVHVC